MSKSLITTGQMKDMHDIGLSYQLIAKVAGISRQAVHGRLKYYGTPEYNQKRRTYDRQQKEGK